MFILNNIRNIFFLLVLCHYVSANKQSFAGSFPKSKTHQLQPLEHLSDNNPYKKPVFKKWYKPKGTEVEVPHLSELAVARYFTGSEPVNFNALKRFSCFSPYTPGKRGPPSI